MKLPEGFSASGVACGLKPSGNPDLGMIVSDRPATAAGVFTTNRVQAAPVQLTRRHIRRSKARAIVVNAGNANACTGKQGYADARSMAEHAARGLAIKKENVLVNSTGIIGVPLDMTKVREGIEAGRESGAIVADVQDRLLGLDSKPYFNRGVAVLDRVADEFIYDQRQ